MKKVALAVALGALVVNAANRDVELSTLDGIVALERAPGSALDGTRRAITWINEHALSYLPVAAMLRAEDVVARVAVRVIAPRAVE